MNKTEFIETLAEKTGLTQDQAATVNDIIENHSIIGKKSKQAVASEIVATLEVDAETADQISNTASEIIATAIKDKIKHPFGLDKD